MPWTAGINPRAASELLLFLSRSNLSQASSTREQVWFTTTFSSEAKDYSFFQARDIYSDSKTTSFFLQCLVVFFFRLQSLMLMPKFPLISSSVGLISGRYRQKQQAQGLTSVSRTFHFMTKSVSIFSSQTQCYSSHSAQNGLAKCTNQ